MCSVLCAVILSGRTTGSEATRWSASFQVRRLWMQDRAARLGTMGQAAILPPDLGVFPFFLSFERTNERIISFLASTRRLATVDGLSLVARQDLSRGSYQLAREWAVEAKKAVNEGGMVW